jgi:DNA-binding GntR family transcriptional regulator
MSMTISEKKTNGKRSSRRAEHIFNRLVTEIVAGTIPSGQPMREAKMARQWGVSRTPMREAVRRVAEFGLLTLRRNRAPLVRAFTAREVEGLYKMREVLEVLALREAWDHIPPQLIRDLRKQAEGISQFKSDDRIDQCLALDGNIHRVWIDHCQNPWLTQSLQRIWTYIRIFQRFMARDPELVRRSYKEHCRILQTLGTPVPQAGVSALRTHIRRSAAAVKMVVPP